MATQGSVTVAPWIIARLKELGKHFTFNRKTEVACPKTNRTFKITYNTYVKIKCPYCQFVLALPTPFENGETRWEH